MTYTERMNKGLDYLDANVPGWPSMVNPATLNMGSLTNCVVGQVMGHKWFCDSAQALMDISTDPAVHDYRSPYDWAVDHGFDNVQEAGDGNEANDLWIAAIRERVLVPA